MKLLVTTRADEGIKSMTDYTHPVIKYYADKVGADFQVMGHESGCTHNQGRWHYRIFKHKELHKEYDRILHIDSDTVITPNCPNIFEVVPYDCIGTVYEDKGSRAVNRHERIKKAKTQFGNIDWTHGYIDTGVFLTSKIHRDIFQTIDNNYYEDNGFDDVHLGYLINKYKFKVHELDYRWNHMTMFSEPWNGSPSRFDSHIIHYAGAGTFNKPNKLEQIKSDVYHFYKEK